MDIRRIPPIILMFSVTAFFILLTFIISLVNGGNSTEESTKAQPEQPVVLCVREIPAGTSIDASMVAASARTKDETKDSTSAIIKSESEAIGKVASHTLKQGQLISEGDLK